MNDGDKACPEKRRTILVLEDDPNRLDAMAQALKTLGKPFEIRHWDDVGTMRVEAPKWFGETCLISLDYDLSEARSTGGRGTENGMDAVTFLNRHEPFCPVIVHTSLRQESGMMAEALRRRGWRVAQVILSKRERMADWRDAVDELPG
jgi:hypothetical protein